MKTKSQQKFEKQCPFCGKHFKTNEENRGFCERCITNGFHWVYEVTGRTNGWDKRVA